MARTPSPLGEYLLGQPSISEQVMRALGLKGDLPQYLLGQFLPVFQAEDYTQLEYLWLRRTATWEIGLTQSAVAAQFSIFNFDVNASSGRRVMCVIDRMWVTNPNAGAMAVRYAVTFAGAGGVAATSTGQPVDDRQVQIGVSTTQPTARCGTGTNAAAPLGGAGINGAQAIIPASAAVLIPGPWVLTGSPGAGVFQGAFVVETTQVNLTMHVTLRWRERVILDSEL